MSEEFTGIKLGVPTAEYREADGINISALKEMGTSAKHYLDAITATPEPSTDAQKIGTATHAAVLENDHSTYVIRPHGLKFTTAAGKEWRDAQTKPILDREEAENLHGMVTAIKNHPMANRILFGPGGNNEVCCWKTHETTGLLLKGRADRVTEDSQNKIVVVDLKTCQRGDALQWRFAREILKWKYDEQASFYQQLFGASFFCFVCVEKEKPYGVACYHLDADDLNEAYATNEKHLAKVKECSTSGIWPCYSDDLQTIKLKRRRE